MNRRTALQLLGSTFGAAFLQPFPALVRSAAAGKDRWSRLFFVEEELPRVRANTETPLLRNYFEQCVQANLEEDRQFLRTVGDDNLVRDLLRLQRLLRRECLVYLVTRDPNRRVLIREAVETALKFSKWDFFVDGSNQTIGFQRAPETLIAVLFARSVAGNLTEPADEKLFTELGEKGCMPAFRSLWGMKNPRKATGWHFHPDYAAKYPFDLRRWPIILDRTNLKAVPISALGLGALALDGVDRRAGEWLEMAVTSAKAYLGTYRDDGSCEEGLGYADYALRNLFVFFDAHKRLRGDVDWFDMANFHGFAEYIVCTQLGRYLNEDVPDIVNFPDGRVSIHPGTAFWIANKGNDPLAQYAGENFSGQRDYFDYLWYQPDRQSSPPSQALKNKRFDLDWVVCRTGWGENDTFVAFRSGGPGNHEQANRNSFILKAHSERLLTDHVSASYDWSDPGWLLRLPQAHNSVLVDGKGHDYHDGREGTNPSKAHAKIVRYVDHGDVVWWCSDATEAYRLVNDDIDFVLRSLLFVKPDIVVVHDRVRKKQRDSILSARFHPDNRDEMARFEIVDDGQNFSIRRPRATLFGAVAASLPSRTTRSVLNLPKEKGIFPFIEVTTGMGTKLELVTALVARAGGGAQFTAGLEIERVRNDWSIQVGKSRVVITSAGRLPEFSVEARK